MKKKCSCSDIFPFWWIRRKSTGIAKITSKWRRYSGSRRNCAATPMSGVWMWPIRCSCRKTSSGRPPVSTSRWLSKTTKMYINRKNHHDLMLVEGWWYWFIEGYYLQILNVSAVVLANLCVCYLVTSQNEEAEELLRKLEKEEEQCSLENPQSKFFHLSIVNLVIGYRQ